MEKNIVPITKTESHNMKKKEIIPVTAKDSINPSKRKINTMSIEESAHAIQKLIQSKIIIREKRIKIISRSSGVQIGWRIKKEYEDGSKSNEVKYFN